MINLITIATRPAALSDQLGIPCRTNFRASYQARPGAILPLIINRDAGSEVDSAIWGCQVPSFTMPISAFPIDRVMGQKPFNRWIHTQRCLIPANCFFARTVRRESRDTEIYLIRLLQSRLFLIGGLFKEERDTDDETRCSFCILTTESADVLKSVTPLMPVLIPPDHMKAWLNAKHVLDLMHLADRSGDHWFDYFPVSSKILQPGINDRELLKPLGLSVHQRTQRELRLGAINTQQDRFNRKGGKH
jgi:putative SOS response-associated peptidase YedK